MSVNLFEDPKNLEAPDDLLDALPSVGQAAVVLALARQGTDWCVWPVALCGVKAGGWSFQIPWYAASPPRGVTEVR